MLKNYLLIIYLLGLVACNNQSKSLNLSADYISLYFIKDKNNSISKWETVREMPLGAFSCQEQENGDLIIKYNPKDSVTKFVNVSDNKSLKASLDKLPKSLSNLKFKGIYLNPTEPYNFFQAVYTSNDEPNTMCIVTFTIPDVSVVGAVLYSDKPKNPLKEENIKLWFCK